MLLRCGLIDAALDFEVVPIEVGKTNAIANQSQVLCARWARLNSGAALSHAALC